MNTTPSQSQLLETERSPSPISEKNTGNQASNSLIGRVRRLLANRIIETTSISLSLALVLFGVSSWNVWTIYKGFQETVTREIRLRELSSQLLYIDEVLTMSANMAATTGERRWVQRYKLYEPALDSVTAELLQLSPSLKANFEPTQTTSEKLLKLERQAFELVRQGRGKEASNILFGREYSSQKTILAQGYQNAIDQIQVDTKAELDFYRQRLFWSLIFAGASVPLLILVWLVIQSSIGSYIQDRKQAQEGLQQLNEELEERVRQRTQSLSSQNDKLSELARNEGLIQGNAKAAVKAFTEAATSTLGIDRVSVWLYNSDRTSIVCFDLYEHTSGQHSEGMELKVSDFPNYFQALTEDPIIVAKNAHAHPATRDFAQSHLTPLDIQSRLDIPIQSAGQTVGVICCEQIGRARQWNPEEQTFVGSIANLVALTLDNQTTQQEVEHLLDIVSNVESGDLTTRANVSDRVTGLVADTFNRLIEQLSGVLAQVSGTAQQVTQSSQQLDRSAKIVALNTQQQAQEIARVLELTEQVQISARDSTERMNLANQSLGEVETTIEQGQLAIDSLTQGIQTLQVGADRIVQRTQDLDEFVVLTDQFLQEQSQLAELIQSLAMGATLLSARATAQQDPRQMMVLAKEFETIANQIKGLAEQTNQNLRSLQKRTDRMEESVASISQDLQSIDGLVDGFTQEVAKSTQVFSSLQKTTKTAIATGETVAESSQQIVQTALVTATAMGDIARLAEQTAELTQAAQTQSERMQRVSQQLLERVGFFQLPEGAIARVDLSQEKESTFDVAPATTP